MTTGQLLFYGGAALLGLTVLLAIIFIIKKPKYTPETAAYSGADPGRTSSFLNGYPTDPMTVRGGTVQPAAAGTVRQPQETELFTGPFAETRIDPQPGTEWSQETDVMGP